MKVYTLTGSGGHRSRGRWTQHTMRDRVRTLCGVMPPKWRLNQAEQEYRPQGEVAECQRCARIAKGVTK